MMSIRIYAKYSIFQEYRLLILDFRMNLEFRINNTHITHCHYSVFFFHSIFYNLTFKIYSCIWTQNATINYCGILFDK